MRRRRKNALSFSVAERITVDQSESPTGARNRGNYQRRQENRVGLTPAGVAALRRADHEVVIERGAGVGSGFGDGDYAASGAALGSAGDAWAPCSAVRTARSRSSAMVSSAGTLVTPRARSARA